jgi:nucleotide-binding universal stress UspA family protein
VSVAIVLAAALVALAVGVALGWWLPPNGRRPRTPPQATVRRILLPLTGAAISRRAFEAAVRLARAEDAILMPALLARVPRHLPIDAPLPAQAAQGMPLIEAIEQQAGARGVAVDSRVARGRTYRDALGRLLTTERFDRIIVSVGDGSRTELPSSDLEWLLHKAPAEVLILRPAPDDSRRISGRALSGHF